MDKIIKTILDKLENSGFESYVVGGYVRDLLLGIQSTDIDICTAALPKDIHLIFNISPNNYGGAKLIIDNYNIDITTFRKESDYVNRTPTKVNYIKDLDQDLLRRDFTINAICMDKFGKIIDKFDAVSDINNRLIKMIGEPDVRLAEDPLRILRAIRFATVLNFNIESSLLKSIVDNYYLVKNLSKKRIRDELDKILLSKNYKRGLKLLKDLGISDAININFDNVNYTKDILGMWAQINFCDLPFTNNEKSNIIEITEVVKYGKVDFNTLFTYGLYINLIAGEILNISGKNISKMYKSMPIKDKKDINIKGNEIEELLNIIDKKEIGIIYNELIEKILSGNLKNKKSNIQKYLMQRK